MRHFVSNNNSLIWKSFDRNFFLEDIVIIDSNAPNIFHSTHIVLRAEHLIVLGKRVLVPKKLIIVPHTINSDFEDGFLNLEKVVVKGLSYVEVHRHVIINLFFFKFNDSVRSSCEREQVGTKHLGRLEVPQLVISDLFYADDFCELV